MSTSAPSSTPRSAFLRLRRGMLLCAAALVLLFLGTTTLDARRGARAGHATPPAQADRGPAGPDRDREAFERFALNVLLVPLLDDDEPARWTDTAVQHQCGPRTHVEVDGRPMVPGTPIPATAFTVRWHIDQCWPLDDPSLALSGTVDLLVFHEDLGLSAVVSAGSLVVSTPGGVMRMGAPFAAAMNLTAGEAWPAR